MAKKKRETKKFEAAEEVLYEHRGMRCQNLIPVYSPNSISRRSKVHGIVVKLNEESYEYWTSRQHPQLYGLWGKERDRFLNDKGPFYVIQLDPGTNGGYLSSAYHGGVVKLSKPFAKLSTAKKYLQDCNYIPPVKSVAKPCIVSNLSGREVELRSGDLVLLDADQYDGGQIYRVKTARGRTVTGQPAYALGSAEPHVYAKARKLRWGGFRALDMESLGTELMRLNAFLGAELQRLKVREGGKNG
jgi:hypothetical protein